ncbi:Trm82p [Sporobolomyces koalae]|uniref:Trm82p n=1 Tax=Sporobolomyces koalae TaxID=500713 RepID=UPI00317754A4
MQHPVQALAVTESLVVTACNSTLACFDLATSTRVATATPHTALVRSLATYHDTATATSFVVSTGEDKQLIVSKLPSLEFVSKREIMKRANTLDVTANGEIVVGDKFGDVYTFPLHPAHAPDPAASKPQDKKQGPEYLPVLGHVSMLNALALIPGTDGKQYIATGDRDEHVRVSRFPHGHIIEGFLWGSKQFVSSLLYLPPVASSSAASSSTVSAPLLLSAGGDPTIQAYSLTLPSTTPAPASTSNTASPVGDLVGQFNIEDLLLEHVVVAPVLPDPMPAGRKKDKKGKKKLEGGEDAGAEGEDAASVEPQEKKELKTGLAVIKMVEVGATREEGGIVVLAAGSTALLYIPFSCLLPSLFPIAGGKVEPSIVSFPSPILDFAPLPVPAAADSAVEFLVSLDSTRTSSSSTSTPDELFARVAVSATTRTLTVLPRESTAVFSSASESIEQQPSIGSLYPVLMLLHHPGEDYEGGGGAENGTKPSDENVGDGKPKGGKRGSKRTSDERESVPDAATATDEPDTGAWKKNGKRAVGRAETLRRWEEAKLKLEQGVGKEDLSVGEKLAVKEIEDEQQQQQASEQ